VEGDCMKLRFYTQERRFSACLAVCNEVQEASSGCIRLLLFP
jgi:hypothetical protein